MIREVIQVNNLLVSTKTILDYSGFTPNMKSVQYVNTTISTHQELSLEWSHL